MTTLTTLPAQALPGKQLQFIFTASGGGNYAKVWCTSAPRGSALRQKLDAAQAERVVVIAETDITKRPQYTFDVGGTYVLQIEEFQKGAENYGGRYKGDPDGYRTEDRITTATVNLSVATLLECELGVTPDVATLQVYVSDTQIIETTEATHGVASPSIERPATDKARAAADADSVVGALTDLGGVNAEDAIGSLTDRVTELINLFNLHIADATHDNADGNNAIDVAFRFPRNLKSIARSLAECAKRYTYHITNVDPDATAPDPGSGNYHVQTDWENYLLAQGGSTLNACQILMSDIERAYSGHIENTDSHSTVSAFPLSTQASLAALHSAFLAELVALAPTAPANEHTAKVLLVSGAGFKEA